MLTKYMRFIPLVLLLAHPAIQAEVNICNPVGLFQFFLDEDLTITGNCDDSDQLASIVQTPGGTALRGLGDNQDIPISIASDFRGTANNITQFGITKHTADLRIKNAETIGISISHPSGGSCVATARGTKGRCQYLVTFSNCPLDLLVGDTVCMPCTGKKCKDYGNAKIKVFAGKPVKQCTVSLKRVRTACFKCKAGKGKPAVPVAQ